MSFHFNVSSLRERFGFELMAWVPLPRPLHFESYSQWLSEGKHGEMTYLQNQAPLKQDPRNVMPTAQSMIIVAQRYKPHPQKIEIFPEGLKIASYARGEDYHHWLADKLNQLCQEIKQSTPEFEFLVATDSKPFLERDLAQQAGLGWIGKNTCLIHPEEGSFFFIAEALTTHKISEPETMQPLPDFCGNCQRCITACPTQALESPRVLNATKCIAYWTIEAKSTPPPDIRDQMKDLFFGCDICQDVCPWNEKVFRKNPLPAEIENPESEIEELRFFLTASNREMERKWGHTPLICARPRGLRRNALIVAANQNLQMLKPEILRWKEDADLGELAQWALNQLSKQESKETT